MLQNCILLCLIISSVSGVFAFPLANVEIFGCAILYELCKFCYFLTSKAQNMLQLLRLWTPLGGQIPGTSISRPCHPFLNSKYATKCHCIIFKKNWRQFLFFVYAAALKQQISKLIRKFYKHRSYSHHFYVSRRPVIHVKATYLAFI